MPTYLLHGFRWARASIRIHIILHNIDDAAAEWILAPPTSISLLNSFYTLFDFLPPSDVPPPSYLLPASHERVVVQDVKKEEPPRLLSRGLKGLRRISSATAMKANPSKYTNGGSQRQRPMTSSATTIKSSNPTLEVGDGGKKVHFNDWSVVKLLEQFDPDEMVVSQPYAFVADYMVRIELSASLPEEMAKYEARQKEEAALNWTAVPRSRAGSVDAASRGAEGGVSAVSPLAQERRGKRIRWFEKLKDELQKDTEIGWFVVVCGDEERAVVERAESVASASGLSSHSHSEVSDPAKMPTKRGFRGFFSRKKTAR